MGLMKIFVGVMLVVIKTWIVVFLKSMDGSQISIGRLLIMDICGMYGIADLSIADCHKNFTFFP